MCRLVDTAKECENCRKWEPHTAVEMEMRMEMGVGVWVGVGKVFHATVFPSFHGDLNGASSVLLSHAYSPTA